MVKGIRFRPPRVVVGAELEWVLARAFGAVLPLEGLDGAMCLEVARRLGLQERLGGLIPTEQLAAELGEEAAQGMRRAYRVSVGNLLHREEACRHIAETLSASGIPMLFLKGAALQLGEHGKPGLRRMGDIDLLVPEQRLHEAAELLVNRGWKRTSTAESEHQLPPLISPTGNNLELHRLVRGVELEPGRAAVFEHVQALGSCRELDGWPQGTLLPERSFLAAHTLVHGFAQHGLQPQGYPLFRVLADVQDLAFTAAERRSFAAGPQRWIARALSAVEVAAVWALLDALAGGGSPAAVAARADGPALLLRHMLAGSFDEQYATSLRFQKLARPLGGGSRLRSFAILLRNNLWMDRAVAEARYGPLRGPFTGLRLRLRRPLELLGQVVRSLAAWLRLRRRC